MKYADSGVNIDAATRALARSKGAVRSTWDQRVKNEMGAFGGLLRGHRSISLPGARRCADGRSARARGR